MRLCPDPSSGVSRLSATTRGGKPAFPTPGGAVRGVGEGCHRAWPPVYFFSAEDCSSLKIYFSFVHIGVLFRGERRLRPPRRCPWPGAAAPPAGREEAPGALPAALKAARRGQAGQPSPRGHGLRGPLASKQAEVGSI